MIDLHFSHKGSLVRRLNAIILIMGITIVSSFLILFFSQRQTLKEYEHFIRVNSNLSQLPYYFYEAASLFSDQINDTKEENIKKLNAVFDKIELILSMVDDEVKRSDVLIYKRSLRMMYSYWRDNVLESLEKPPGLGDEAFAEGSYLRRLSGAIDRQARLFVVSYLSASSVQNRSNLLQTQNLSLRLLILSLVLALMSILAGRIMTSNIVRDVKRISVATEKLSRNDFRGKPIKSSVFEELNIVVNAFNRMHESIHTYIVELQSAAEIERELNEERLRTMEKDQLLRETQLHALHMQINPHFLFNALNTVNRLALKSDNESIIEFISAMSKILRFNIENEGGLVEFEDEFAVLQAYIHIQKARFGERISFSIPEADKVPKGSCPPMMLQPLVENAIIHGLQNRESGGKIQVSVEPDRNGNIISVHDNGTGIPEEIANSALNGILESESSRKSIGIYNIARRLELYFNKSDLLEIKSLSGKGTQIRIFLPDVGFSP